MCRLVAWAASEPQGAAEILDAAEFSALTRLSRFHRDGWGLATAGGEHVRRSTRAAGDDPTFPQAAAELRGRAGLVHLRRASPGLAVVPENTHPFVLEGWAFAHNGTIADPERLDGLLTTRWRECRRGTTDSERYFLLFLQALSRLGDPLAAMRDAVGTIRDACGANGLNAVACSAEHLVAVQAAEGRNPDRSTLIALMGEDVADPSTRLSAEHLEDYFGLRYHLDARRFVVASTGVAGPEWEKLPEESLVASDLARAVTECRALSGDQLLFRVAGEWIEHQSAD